MKPTIVITGSEGLIGSALIRKFCGSFQVAGLDRTANPELDGMRKLIECDLTSDESVAAAIDRIHGEFGNRVASVVHLAAYYDFSGKPSRLYEELTHKGTERLLANVRKLRVEQFVFSSTILVMKPSEGGRPITEQSPVQAEWPYPQSKLDTEEMICRERGDIPAVILRIAGVYDETGRAVPLVQQMRRIYERRLESLFFPGDDSHGQTMVHIDDLAEAIWQVVSRRGQLGAFETFLIGERDVLSYEELQNRIGELIHGKQWPSIRIPAVAAKLGARASGALGRDQFIQPWMIDLADQDYRIDISRAAERLDWTPSHSLRETLPAIAEKLVEDPTLWYRENGLGSPPS